MIIDGHHHIEGDYGYILRRMNELQIDKTVLVGAGVRDLSGHKMARICEMEEEKNVPVFFHQGLTPESSDARKMVKNFRNVTFIVAHAGVQCFYDVLDLAMAYDNVFIDTSSYIVTFRKLKHLCRKIGAKKIVFGTDVPVMSNDPSEGLAKIRRLPVSESNKELILGKNLWEILERSKK